MIALTPLALWPSFSILAIVIGFLLFRLFDIFKPYPIRKLEHLHAGLGVMADDVLAGIYAAVVLWLVHLSRLTEVVRGYANRCGTLAHAERNRFDGRIAKRPPFAAHVEFPL